MALSSSGRCLAPPSSLLAQAVAASRASGGGLLPVWLSCSLVQVRV